MSSSPREENRVPGLVAKSDADNTPVIIEADPVTKRLKVNATVTGGPAGQPTTPTVTVVGDSITSGTLIAANSSRKEVEFFNGSTAILYLLKGTGTASTSNYTVQVLSGGYYTTNITSAFTGIWASDAGGSVFITESV